VKTIAALQKQRELLASIPVAGTLRVPWLVSGSAVQHSVLADGTHSVQATLLADGTRSVPATQGGGQFANVVRCACDSGSDGSGGETVVDRIRLFPLHDDGRWRYRVHE
jgi:hypothetical protein